MEVAGTGYFSETWAWEKVVSTAKATANRRDPMTSMELDAD